MGYGKCENDNAFKKHIWLLYEITLQYDKQSSLLAVWRSTSSKLELIRVCITGGDAFLIALSFVEFVSIVLFLEMKTVEEVEVNANVLNISSIVYRLIPKIKNFVIVNSA